MGQFRGDIIVIAKMSSDGLGSPRPSSTDRSFDRSTSIDFFQTPNSTMDRRPGKFSGLKNFRQISSSPGARWRTDIQISVGRAERILIEQTLNAPLRRSSTKKKFPLSLSMCVCVCGGFYFWEENSAVGTNSLAAITK